ncbi:glutathione S-transferase family protein [Caulobacter segnis]|uniref:glutathione S-transferase family protein n=1 Tax=Caulobacter segnis TaxID=88688 RepID=UPI00240EA624|nr:glutathione S-transferase family protein [Caulobacter segnis]MDG2522693.1 glutathione S-transferase family protein [Caulobacter segnis]
MKLYHDPLSTDSRAVLLFAHEHRLKFDEEIVSIWDGAHLSDVFAGLNPDRTLPLLVDRNLRLTQASTILKYLAELTGSQTYPHALHPRMLVNERLDWFSNALARDFLHGFVYPQMFPACRYADGEHQAALRRHLAAAHRKLYVLDRHFLGASPYVCGQEVTIADYLGATYVGVGDWIGFSLADYPRIAAWMDRMRSLQSWSTSHHEFEAGLIARWSPEIAERLAGTQAGLISDLV